MVVDDPHGQRGAKIGRLNGRAERCVGGRLASGRVGLVDGQGIGDEVAIVVGIAGHRHTDLNLTHRQWRNDTRGNVDGGDEGIITAPGHRQVIGIADRDRVHRLIIDIGCGRAGSQRDTAGGRTGRGSEVAGLAERNADHGVVGGVEGVHPAQGIQDGAVTIECLGLVQLLSHQHLAGGGQFAGAKHRDDRAGYLIDRDWAADRFDGLDPVQKCRHGFLL
ncbi:hypothetical protein D3C85_704590 [compost metagenome]